MRATLNLIETVGTLADPLAVLTARAEARASLWSEGEIAELPDAVDPLQFYAERTGLVELIGQDRVQSILARAFRAVRRPYIVESVDEVADPSPEPEPGHRAAESVVDALMHSLRSRGVAALAEHDTQRRLGELSTRQVREVIARLIAMRSSYPAISDELLSELRAQLP